MATPGICVGRAPLAVHLSSISMTAGVYVLSIDTTTRTTKYKAPTVPAAIAWLRVNVDMIRDACNYSISYTSYDYYII